MKLRPLLLHLRFPFSLYLLPVFLFALSQATSIVWSEAILSFIVLHVFLYPSSNGYNSYMDQDTDSIGGLKNPPKVPKEMFVLSLVLDLIGLILLFTFISSPYVGILGLAYILASRAYSYRKIRIKKYPIMGFLHVSIFQGGVIFVLSSLSFHPSLLFDISFVLSLTIAFLLVAAGYPLTQVYQHEQDRREGVSTLSMLLGKRGTFIFSGLLFALLAVLVVIFYVWVEQKWLYALLFFACNLPVFVFFMRWMLKVFANPMEANFENTMKMNNRGAICVNLFFLILLLLQH
jgi:1,4-dihydroxy-2-naphthoate octaprenyltransferase